jgi:hypothetical protein
MGEPMSGLSPAAKAVTSAAERSSMDPTATNQAFIHCASHSFLSMDIARNALLQFPRLGS